ncbi:DUF4465 domain-containing protein [Aquabacterium soli]|uniref:DUF4465 domain-containing protein n=1 Tax=Aquabacterium soli TaxID=2493092 RepID=A0A426VCX4_9BURK|nr:DUF4465 domain-containing protein [Aquabacterium soli]RRS04630.1 DUF4465 domain-containing protein [Aquabacterium soli]
MQHTLIGACLALCATLGASSAQAATTSTFEELALAPSSHYFPQASTTFTSGAATFSHAYSSDYGSWSQWVYSNETDTTTAGYENQFSVFNSSGAAQSSNFAIAYVSSYEPEPTTITFAAPVQLNSVALTNTTYAALSMQQGDSFAKKFGGISGNDADYFYVSIIGKAFDGSTTGTVDVYLADYRFGDNSQDYILDQWLTVNLSSLGTVSSLQFEMYSSDTGLYGINTPTYFALDNLSVAAAVPEPSTAWLSLAGVGLMAAALRRRKLA